jgi:hypothetical protein
MKNQIAKCKNCSKTQDISGYLDTGHGAQHVACGNCGQNTIALLSIEIINIKTGETVNTMTQSEWVHSLDDDRSAAVNDGELDLRDTLADYNQTQECGNRDFRAKLQE